MDWYCVHIAESRAYEASRRTFLQMLKNEHLAHDPAIDCPVYGMPANDGDGYCYIFSPAAAEQHKELMIFWGGFKFHQPIHFNKTQRIV
jgi:hypothetical protein